MKKNLKKATALALAALTVASMSSIAFASQGDIDGDGLLTANDAAIANFNGKNPAASESQFGSKIVAGIEKDGAVTFNSLVTGSVGVTDAGRILQVVKKGGSFDTYVADDYKDELAKAKDGNSSLLTIAPDGTVTIPNMVVRNADGTIQKNGDGTRKTASRTLNTKVTAGDTTDSQAALDALSEIEAMNNFDPETPAETAESYVFRFTYGDTTVRVDVDDDKTNVLTALQAGLDGDYKTTVTGKINGLANALKAFKVNGVALDEVGWAKLGEQVAADKSAFASLYPVNTNSYLTNFTSNIKKAFPASYKATALANIEKFNVTSSDAVSLTIDGNTITDSKKAFTTFVDKFLFVDGTAKDYDFNTLAFTFGGSNVVKVEKSVVTE